MRSLFGIMLVCSLAAGPLHAQTQTIDDLKGKLFDAHMMEKMFVGGLKFCKELDGKNFFYFQPRNRVLNLDEYHRSLENLAREHVFNPEKHRPWSDDDAAERWEVVKKEAVTDKENCDLVASIPDLEKKLQELEKQAVAPSKKE
jgi:hypothetical protein